MATQPNLTEQVITLKTEMERLKAHPDDIGQAEFAALTRKFQEIQQLLSREKSQQQQPQQLQQGNVQHYPLGPTGTELFENLGQAPTAQIAAQLGQPGAVSQPLGQQGMGVRGARGGARAGGRGGQSLQTRFQPPRPNRPRPLNFEIRHELIKNKPRTLRDVFLKEPIEELAFRNFQSRRTILIGEEKILERTLTRINKHNIHSLPVVSTAASGIIGTIDVLDIIHALIRSIDQSQISNIPGATVQQKVRRDFMNRRVSEFVSRNGYVISTRASLWDAVKGFVETKQDRFVIVNREVNGVVEKFATTQEVEHDIHGVLTMSDCLKFLVANSMYMREEPMFEKTLQELGLGKIAPKTIHHLQEAAEGFRMMDQMNHDGLAVVDDQGRLIGNLSACDTKGITRVNCPILNSKLEDYLVRDNRREWFYRPLVLSPQDSLYHTIHQFVSLGKQRFYFVDNEGKPIGEIGRRDIINVVWKIIQGDRQDYTDLQQHPSGAPQMRAFGGQQQFGGQQFGGQQQQFGGQQQQAGQQQTGSQQESYGQSQQALPQGYFVQPQQQGAYGQQGQQQGSQQAKYGQQ